MNLPNQKEMLKLFPIFILFFLIVGLVCTQVKIQPRDEPCFLTCPDIAIDATIEPGQPMIYEFKTIYPKTKKKK